MLLSESQSQLIDSVVEVLKASRNLLFVTGAGMSADSGLPTYRGIGGLYNSGDTDDGLPIEEALSGETMRRRPALTWKYLGQIEKAARQARCNRGHEVIAEMESAFERVWTLTQNIDSFHRQAGAKNVMEIHGDLHDLYCLDCEYEETVTDYGKLAIPPRCPVCGGTVRPAVVLFGEMLPLAVLERLDHELRLGFDAVFSIGTTSVFPYIAQPVFDSRRRGKPTVEINLGESKVSSVVDIRLPLNAATALDEIWRRYQGSAGL